MSPDLGVIYEDKFLEVFISGPSSVTAAWCIKLNS